MPLLLVLPLWRWSPILSLWRELLSVGLLRSTIGRVPLLLLLCWRVSILLVKVLLLVLLVRYLMRSGAT